MKVLITGGAGFIGSHLIDHLLARGHTPIAFDNEQTGRRANVSPAAEFIAGDVRDTAALEAVFARGVDAVLHIAGQASIRLSFMEPGADLDTNTRGTIEVLQACIRHRVSRLLFASSMTVYGKNPPSPTPESAPIDPVSYYAITKYAAERYVHATAARDDLGFNLNVTSFRMFNVYGQRQSLTNAYQGVFAIFLGNVLRGEPINIHADGKQSRDFVHIDDIARAWCDAIDAPATVGQVINLGTGVPRSVNQLADRVLESAGRTRADYPIIYHPAQPGDMRRSMADITRARELLDWSPQVDFEAGMARTIEWARRMIGG